MSYEYVDPKRESETHALPDVEVWESVTDEVNCKCGTYTIPWESLEEMRCPSCNSEDVFLTPRPTPYSNTGWFYAYGFPGCLWGSDPIGPFDTYAEALADARENAGVYDE